VKSKRTRVRASESESESKRRTEGLGGGPGPCDSGYDLRKIFRLGPPSANLYYKLSKS
jgi:hypothetical protein